jgi:hypothetical protein
MRVEQQKINGLVRDRLGVEGLEDIITTYTSDEGYYFGSDDMAYLHGDMCAQGRPYEVQVSLCGGKVDGMFEVVGRSIWMVEVLVFVDEESRRRYLESGILYVTQKGSNN